MSETDTLHGRVDALEMRIAYQDDTIETLNATITAQWKQIDLLTRQVSALGHRLAEAETAVASTPGSEKPPHY